MKEPFIISDDEEGTAEVETEADTRTQVERFDGWVVQVRDDGTGDLSSKSSSSSSSSLPSPALNLESGPCILWQCPTPEGGTSVYRHIIIDSREAGPTCLLEYMYHVCHVYIYMI